MKHKTITAVAVTGIAVGFALPLHPWLNLQRTETPREVPVVIATTEAPHIEEDDPRFNCMTMGNKVCGPSFVPVTQELGDSLAEGDDRTGYYRWEDCLVQYNDNDHVLVVCPDGNVVRS